MDARRHDTGNRPKLGTIEIVFFEDQKFCWKKSSKNACPPIQSVRKEHIVLPQHKNYGER